MKCTKCGTDKLDSEFSSRIRNGKSTPLRHCKDCVRKRQRKYYDNNKELCKARTKTLRQSAIVAVQKLKEAPCTDCHNSYPYYVMDFDHRDPQEKHMSINELVRHMPSFDRVLEEIKKCDLVCSNCHRIRTYKQNLTRNGMAWRETA